MPKFNATIMHMIKLYKKLHSLFLIKISASDILIAMAIYVALLYAYSFAMQAIMMMALMSMSGSAS